MTQTRNLTDMLYFFKKLSEADEEPSTDVEPIFQKGELGVAKESRKMHLDKYIELIIQNGNGGHYHRFPYIEEMDESALADILGAKKILKYDPKTGHVQDFDNHTENPGELTAMGKYLVITNDIPATEKTIRDYKHGN